MVSKYVKLHNIEDNKNLMIAGQLVEYEIIPDEQVFQDLIKFAGLDN